MEKERGRGVKQESRQNDRETDEERGDEKLGEGRNVTALLLINCVWRRAVCCCDGTSATLPFVPWPHKAVYGAANFFMKLALASSWPL